jgi:hypothetical protein
MKKSNLAAGFHFVKKANGSVAMVLRDNDGLSFVNVAKGGEFKTGSADNYTEDLISTKKTIKNGVRTTELAKGFDIVEVLAPRLGYDMGDVVTLLLEDDSTAGLVTVWKRPVVVEMTLADVARKLGVDPSTIRIKA